MTPTPKRKNPSNEIVQTIENLKGGLHNYPIRDLVKHAEDFGGFLAEEGLKTNQIRKFLDAVNRIKTDFTHEENLSLGEIEVALQMLRPKLAYAVGRADRRQEAAIKSFRDVINAAIVKVKKVESLANKDEKEQLNFKAEFKADFYHLVYLVESIVAYHKANGGKEQ